MLCFVYQGTERVNGSERVQKTAYVPTRSWSTITCRAASEPSSFLASKLLDSTLLRFTDRPSTSEVEEKYVSWEGGGGAGVWLGQGLRSLGRVAIVLLSTLGNVA